MFSGLTTRLKAEVEFVKQTLLLQDSIRTQVFTAPEAGGDNSAAIALLRAAAPTKGEWQVYDHCAALTRLYAQYERFVEDLVKEYLRWLPSIYPQYSELPPSLLKQHRVGFGQILLKIGEKGPYRHLKEQQIVSDLAHGITGNTAYKLLPDAFFVERQNYRFDMLLRVFGYLEMSDVASRLSNDAHLKSLLATRAEEGKNPVEAELNRFVRVRNDAAHAELDETVSTSTILEFADLVVGVCDVLSRAVDEHVLRRQFHLNQHAQIGLVTEVFQDGDVFIARMVPSTIRVGDEIILNKQDSFRRTTILSLQDNDRDSREVTATADQEVGFRISCQASKGQRILIIPRPVFPLIVSEPADAESIAAEAKPRDHEELLEEEPLEDEVGFDTAAEPSGDTQIAKVEEQHDVTPAAQVRADLEGENEAKDSEK